MSGTALVVGGGIAGLVAAHRLSTAGWDVTLAEAHRRLSANPGPDGRGAVPLQGNIDPALLPAPAEVLHRHVDEVLAAGAEAAGHVVNLGHGVPPSTDPQVLTDLVSYIHDQQPAPRPADG